MALESCNFTSFISVNEHFKAHKGKGSYNVPRHLLDQKAKAKCVKEWRTLSSNQQRNIIDDLEEKGLLHPRPTATTAPVTKPKKTKLQVLEEMEYDPNECDLLAGGRDSDKFEYLLHEAEKNMEFSPGRKSCKDLRVEANKKLSQDKANKKKAEKRKSVAERKFCILVVHLIIQHISL
jgi:hypothetical protein